MRIPPALAGGRSAWGFFLRQGFDGQAVPRVVVEFAEPWRSVAKFAPKKEWSRIAEAVRTHFDPEYAKRSQK